MGLKFKRRLAILLLLLAVQGISPGFAAGETIVVVGDSLSSGYGLDGAPSWVAMLAERLRQEGYGYEVVNASIAGDTTAGGLARLPHLLERVSPAWVVLELGGNDGLRGQPVSNMRANLAHMIELARAHNAKVLLLGIRMPPNYGEDYAAALHDAYRDLARDYKVPLVDFLLQGVALDARLMQHDGVHPNAAGQPLMLDNVWHVLAGLLPKP